METLKMISESFTVLKSSKMRSARTKLEIKLGENWKKIEKTGLRFRRDDLISWSKNISLLRDYLI
jgi:hypothetical protein